jgi:hypothetical protein
MIPLPIREAYLNRLTDNGHKFFSLLLQEAFNARLSDGIIISHPEEPIIYYFGLDPLTKQWFGHPDEVPRMFMIEFVSYHHSCSFDESFAFIRKQFIPPAVQSTGWTPAIELAAHKVLTHADLLRQSLKDIPEETLCKMRQEQERNWQEYLKEQERLSQQQYETTPAEALAFYFEPGTKGESIFWTATMVKKFMRDQHPGFWKLSEEETGRLLNSEGFVICKGRHKGARGYFMNYRKGFKPGVYMELKVAG